MRLLLSSTEDAGRELDDAALRDLYAYPTGTSVRANFVSTVDGAAQGADGRSGSINTAADGRVYHLQRNLCDVIVVGAGTARAEGYRRPEVRADGTAPLLVVVSNRGGVPQRLRGDSQVADEADPTGTGRVVLVTRDDAAPSTLDDSRAALGKANVWCLGTGAVNLAALRAELAERGHDRILVEGGPSLFATLLAEGLVDELALTWAPRVVGGSHLRITDGPQLDLTLEARHLLEEDGTLLGLWRVRGR